MAGTVYFADKNAMKGTLFDTIVEAKPTVFFTVPRLFEKIHEKMLSVGAQSGYIKKLIGGWAKRVTLQHHMDRINGNPTNSVQYRIASKFVLSKIKEALGFQRCKTFFTGAAPLNEETKKYFLSLDMFIYEGYGMSESTVHTLTTMETPSMETVGKCLPGTLTKVINLNEDGQGEICMKGRHIFMGYINEPEKTMEAIDDDRWLHSGDLGYIDEDGFIYITGRIKELIITSGGENIPYIRIENQVKNECSAISNAFLVGDNKKFLTMLVTLKTEMSEDGSQLDQLAPETISWLQEIGLNYTKLSEVLSNGTDPKVVKAIQNSVQRANEKAISNAQKVQKFEILPQDFTMNSGELGPTMKLKRNVVLAKYKETIDKMYS
jgi:long-chain-fatty-acid--CoA ligase ACSBG